MMADEQHQTDDQRQPASNTVKDPDQWKTGDEPMTGAQRSYLNTLASEAGEQVEQDLTKAEASNASTNCRRKPAAANSGV